jgi:uncharacterized membrane protein YedE/YeeE
MIRNVFGLLAGCLFSTGLMISHMIDPAKVLNFLNVAGRWDPSLAFVMAAGIQVAAIGYAIAKRRSAPLCDTAFPVLPRGDLDRKLIIGAVLFGAGWGLAGFCPGPALAALPLAFGHVVPFVIAMIIGMALVPLVSPLLFPKHDPALVKRQELVR